MLTLRTQNLHSNNYARKFTPVYTLNSSSRTFCDILKKKQEKKSYDMQNSHQTTVNTIVTSQAQIFNPVKLRNRKRSVQNILGKISSVENYDFTMQSYETIPRIKLWKTTHWSIEPSTVDNAFQTKNILNSYIVTLPPC